MPEPTTPMATFALNAMTKDCLSSFNDFDWNMADGADAQRFEALLERGNEGQLNSTELMELFTMVDEHKSVNLPELYFAPWQEASESVNNILAVSGPFSLETCDSGHIITIHISGLGSIQINRTHEGVIVDAYEPKGEECIASLGLENDDFEPAEEISHPSGLTEQAYRDELERRIALLTKPLKDDIPAIKMLGAKAYEQDYSLSNAVEKWFGEHPVDIKRLKPLNVEITEDYFTVVKKLVRPYIALTDEQYEGVSCHDSGASIFKTDTGRLVVFDMGKCFGCETGYALMPISEEFADDYRKAHEQNTKETGFIYANLKNDYAYQVIDLRLWMFTKTDDGTSFDWAHGYQVKALRPAEYDFLKGLDLDCIKPALKKVIRNQDAHYIFPNEVLQTGSDDSVPTPEFLANYVALYDREHGTVISYHDDGTVRLGSIGKNEPTSWDVDNDDIYYSPSFITPNQDKLLDWASLKHIYDVQEF